MKFWYQSKWNIYAVMLSPLSLIVAAITKIKRYRRSVQSYPVPVIVVGNISVGGTGKTPTIIWLANFLTSKGFSVGVVSRGYGARPNREFPIEVLSTDSAAQVGDEPALIRQKTMARVVIDPNRDQAVKFLCQQGSQKPNLIISDDGMQHYRMARDIELLMVDPLRGFGNGKFLPAGPLRESTSRLGSVDFVLAKQEGPKLPKVEVQVATAKKLLAINSLQQRLALQPIRIASAIGNIDSFAQTVLNLGYAIIEQSEFRDHALLPDGVLEESRIPVVVTEKDYIKLRNPKAHIYYVPFEIDFDDAFKKQLLKRIKETLSEKSNSHTCSI